MGGILTSAEFDRKQEQEGLLHSPSNRTRRMPSAEVLAERGLAKRRRLILPIAPEKGESQAAFYLDGKEVQLTLVDQEYVFPDNMTEAQKEAFAKLLIPAGFVDESTIMKIEPVVKQRRFAHPDNEVSNPVQGEVQFKFKHRKKKYNFVMELDEFGTISTDDPALLQKLDKEGWPEVTIPEGTELAVEDAEMTGPSLGLDGKPEEFQNESGIVTADDESEDEIPIEEQSKDLPPLESSENGNEILEIGNEILETT